MRATHACRCWSRLEPEQNGASRQTFPSTTDMAQVCQQQDLNPSRSPSKARLLHLVSCALKSRFSHLPGTLTLALPCPTGSSSPVTSQLSPVSFLSLSCCIPGPGLLSFSSLSHLYADAALIIAGTQARLPGAEHADSSPALEVTSGPQQPQAMHLGLGSGFGCATVIERSQV